MPTTDVIPVRGPGLIRRLIVITYDALLLAGVVFAGWTVLWILLLPLPDSVQSHPLLTVFQRGYLIGIAFLFYGWFWVNGGQTLGMRAWRLMLITKAGERIGWQHAVARFLFAIVSWAAAGMGFMWVLADRQNRTWHGMASGTRIVMLKKRSTTGSDPGQ